MYLVIIRMISHRHNIVNIVQATHHQGDSRYGASAGIQCSCMSLMAVCWNMFKSVARWDRYDLDRILQSGDQLFKSLNMFRVLGVDDLPARVSIYDSAVDIVFLENKTGEITLNVYLISMTDILSTCSNHGKGALLIISGYVLGIIWGRNCFYLFDSHSKDGEGNVSQNGTAVLLKFDTFSNLEEYIKQIYYSGQNNETLYFQIQFINVVCTHEIKEHIKGKLKSSRNLLCQKIKQRRLGKNRVTGNFQRLNEEKNVKKKEN